MFIVKSEETVPAKDIYRGFKGYDRVGAVKLWKDKNGPDVPSDQHLSEKLVMGLMEHGISVGVRARYLPCDEQAGVFAHARLIELLDMRGVMKGWHRAVITAHVYLMDEVVGLGPIEHGFVKRVVLVKTLKDRKDRQKLCSETYQFLRDFFIDTIGPRNNIDDALYFLEPLT